MNKTKIKIGMVNNSLNMLDHHVAMARGHYADQGLDVELVRMPRNAHIKALAAGDIFLSSFTSAVMNAIVRDGIIFRFVLFTRNGPPHHIIARRDIRTIEDLRGKTVLLGGGGGTNYYMTLDWLTDNGLEPNVDVKVITWEEVAQTLQEYGEPSDLERWVLWASDATMSGGDGGYARRQMLIEQFGFHNLVDLPQAYPKRMVHGLAGAPEILATSRETVLRVVQAHIAAATTIHEEREWCVKLIAKTWAMSPRIAQCAWEDMHHVFIAEMGHEWISPGLDYFVRHMLPEGGESSIPPSSSLVDPSFFAAAKRSSL